MANPIVSTLPEYVDQEKIGLIAKSVLGARTASLINLNTGIKDAATVNLMETDVEFGDGSACGWTAAGSATLSQRKIQTGQIKVNMAFCDKALLKTYAQHQVKIAAGQKTLPFEQEMVEAILKDIQAKLEKAIWAGDTASEDANLDKFDGLIKIIDAAGAKDASLVGGESMYEAIKKVNLALPAEARAEDTVIFVGEDVFAKYVDELVDKNLYHYSADNDGKSYKLPGFDVTVEAVPGLNGSNRIFAGRKSNFFYGCDLAGDAETFELNYSKDNREFRLVVEFNAGVQVAFPDQIVKATLS